MRTMHRTDERRRGRSDRGFTLVELLIAMVISLIVLTSIYSSYHSQQASYIVQEQVAGTQQNLRGALDTMAREIRMAGYDPGDTGNFGISNITLDAQGNWVLRFQADFNEDGNLDADEDITYAMYDYDGDGIINDLGRAENGVTQLLAKNIDGLGFAYAYDYDGGTPDGEMDFDDSNGNGQRDANEPVIWAIDTNGDNQLDLKLDTNDDGTIDENDDNDSDGLIGGQILASTIPITAIKAVKIWLLARTDKSMRGYTDTNTYIVGDFLLTPNGPAASFRRRLLTANVRCRNL